MHPLKRLADGLTWMRVALAVAILVLTITRGPAALELGLQLLVVAWITDALDGALSRRSGQTGTTWIGRHDTLVDIGLATVVWILLARGGLIHPLVAGAYLLAWGGVFWRQRGYRVPQPGLFQGAIYAWTIIQALRHYPSVGRALVLWAVTVIVAGRRRLWEVLVPKFLSGLVELVDARSERHS